MYTERVATMHTTVVFLLVNMFTDFKNKKQYSYILLFLAKRLETLTVLL